MQFKLQSCKITLNCKCSKYWMCLSIVTCVATAEVMSSGENQSI